MDALDEAKLITLDLDNTKADFQLEVYLSSDGKNTVHIKAEDGHKTIAVEKAISLFNFIKEIYGTKQEANVKTYSQTEDLGKCATCGAPNVKYKKSGKIGCGAYCWRK